MRSWRKIIFHAFLINTQVEVQVKVDDLVQIKLTI